METTNFSWLPDLVLIEVFSYFTSVELLHSFWALTTRLDNILFEYNVIRHVDWTKLSDYHRDVTRNRLSSVSSLTTDCLSIAKPLLERKTLRRLTLVNVLPGKLTDYAAADWRHGLDGLQEIHFIATNSSIPSTSDLSRIGTMIAFLIAYVPTLHTVHLPPCYTVHQFGMPPITVANIQHLSVTVSCSTVLLQILLCLRSTLHRLDIGIEFAPYLRQYAVDIQVSTLRDIQVEYVDEPIRSLKQVTLTGISAEFRNEAIVPWIQIFISRTYMPALRRFNFVPPKDPEQTINAEMFAREDLEIKILRSLALDQEIRIGNRQTDHFGPVTLVSIC